MFKTVFFLGFMVLLGTSTADAQIDTSLLINEIEIKVHSIRNKNLGGKKDVIYKGQELGNIDLTSLLSNGGNIYIKSYGANSLGTSSIRGGSAGHSLILWNGIPLQSPTLGLLDLSLIPIQHLDEINVQKGGNSALWGSGAIGGVINLENSMGSDTYVQGNLQLGSFGQLTTGIKLAYGNESYYGSTKFSHSQAKNNFQYSTADNFPLKEQVNAAFKSDNISQDLYFILNENQHINIHYWWQQSKKEIPPTLTQNFNESYQEDEANRLILNWNRINGKQKTHIKLAVLDEKQKYTDPRINLISDNNFTRWFAELGHGINFNNKQQLLVGFTLLETAAKTNGFSDKITETKMGIWLSHQINIGKLKIQSAIREELVEGQLIPVIPSIGIDFKLSKEIKLMSKVSRNYRLATLNDKFWMPGGNSDLLPESGWSQEMSFLFNKSFILQQLNLELTGFNRKIKNWILWSPSDQFGFWQAQNLTEVWSRGIETSGSYQKDFTNSSITLDIDYNYILSTNEVKISSPKIEKGQQLIYTPIHQIGSTLMYRYKLLSLSYQHFFSGKNQGVNDMIPAYTLGNISINYQTKYNQSKFKFYLRIQNIWNVQYVVVERRPMPGINFLTGVNILINKKK